MRTPSRRNATYPTRARVELKPLAERNTVDGVEFVRIPLLHGEQCRSTVFVSATRRI